MNLRKPVRLLVLALIAASFGACHFHGHGWHHHCHPPRHCR
jgi:hypothetical protein